MIEKTFKYQSGEEIRKGDRVLFHGQPAEIELVVTRYIGDPATDWYIENEGPGVMVIEPKVFGRAYIQQTEKSEDLVFVSRVEMVR